MVITTLIIKLIIAPLFLGCASLLILRIFNKLLPKWACTIFKWHLEPAGKDYTSYISGACPRCGRRVIEVSTGIWY